MPVAAGAQALAVGGERSGRMLATDAPQFSAELDAGQAYLLEVWRPIVADYEEAAGSADRYPADRYRCSDMRNW